MRSHMWNLDIARVIEAHELKRSCVMRLPIDFLQAVPISLFAILMVGQTDVKRHEKVV